jgi:transcriptional regulator GlxA family with amidase domain
MAMSTSAPLPVVGILLFDRVEVLDFAGPYEVLSVAKDENGDPCLRVLTLATQPTVVCNGGLHVIVDATLAECPPLDALIVPGGPGADDRTPEQEESLIPFLQDRAPRAKLVASVCTGAFILGRAGLLDGRRATTHSHLLEAFRTEFPLVEAVASKVVDQGAIVTAAGVSSGIDLALYLLDKWFGPDVRERSARNLDGPWQ